MIHFAALKAVGESCTQPLRYYKNNVVGSINLLQVNISSSNICPVVHCYIDHVQVMKDFGVKRLVFSSSATVYGKPLAPGEPFREADPVGECTSPYGNTKLVVETIMKDECKADQVRVLIPKTGLNRHCA